MGRGYSQNRSTSGRPTLKAKRQRSISIHKLRESIESRSPSQGAAEREVVERKPIRRVIRAGGVHITPVAGSVPPKADEPTATTAKEEVVPVMNSKKAKAIKDSVPLNVFLAQKLAKENMDDLEGSEDEEETTRRQDVMTKYKAAGKLVDEVLSMVCDQCVAGANTYSLCTLGDTELFKKVKHTFGKAKTADGEKLARGRAYPCNVSVNNVLCNHSPARPEEATVLKEGDVVKVHLGCHIDGYPACAARTIVVVGSSKPDNEVIPESAVAAVNAIEAARVSLEAIIHLLRPGAENADITDHIARIGAFYDVEAIEGVLSTRTKRWLVDSMDAIITRRVTKEDPQQDVAPVTIQPFQVWTLDVAFTNSPSYKMGVSAEQVNIFRKNEFPASQDLRIPSATEFLGEVTQNFFCFPFHFAHASQPNKARMGISVLKKANLLDEFVVLQSKPKFITARFSATVVVTDKRVNILCGAPVTPNYGAVTPMQAPPDVLALLNEPLVFAQSEQTTQKKAAKKARTEPVATPVTAEQE